MAGNPIVNAGGSEPKKRRRHILLQETIRKSVKKKAEFQQKMLSMSLLLFPTGIDEGVCRQSKKAVFCP
jgi:hypothetical protein